MKLLLDENLPKRLKNDFPDYEIYTVRDQGWNGKKNGELLVLMIENGFDILLTFDKNLQHQQNFNKYPIPILLLNAADNTYQTLSELVPQILAKLQTELPPGATEVNLEE
jgi:predicted nuclease of predicted toxin-antitoxin system